VALAEVLDHFGGDYLIIGEPSDLKLVRAQRGRAEIALVTFGTPSHSSAPQYGVDAVEKMIPLVLRMKDLGLPNHPFLGSGVQALTEIRSEPYPSECMVPYRCCARYDRRLVTGETEESVLQEVEALMKEIRAEDPDLKASAEIPMEKFRAYTGHEYTFKKFLPAWETKEDHPLVRSAARALSKAGITEAPPDYYRFCTNGSLPRRHANLPIIGFGPGDGDLAHRKDEYIRIEDLIRGAKGYTAIALELLSEAPSGG
jgi:acetylornithine deacetylase/succinyl-diaminopimelate desuccinylase-like protein